ncbi:MAG TPA: DUF5719 family protein [Mycobacteriales bacterium]|nr:DUF5719 family protein [Mycobacteriales bacterium]
MRRDTPIFGAVVVAVVVISLFVGATGVRNPARSVGTAPVVARTLICPIVNGSPRHTVSTATVADVGSALPTPVHGTGTVTATVLLGSKSTTSTLKVGPSASVRSRSLQPESVAISSEGTISASLAADALIETSAGRYRALAGGACLPPATDWWFAGGNGKLGFTDRLVLANAASTDADVGVTLWTAKGVVTTPRLAAIRVPARSRVPVGIFTVAPDIPTVAMHVHADSGAVTAAVIDRRSQGLASNGGDLVPPTLPPSRHLVIPGFPATAGPRSLVVVNPGTSDATVSVKVATPNGEFTPSSVKEFVVGPGRTSTVDITAALGGLSGAVLLSSDLPVFASGQASLVPGRSKLRPDFVWLAATKPLSSPAAVAVGREPDGGDCILLLSAPSTRAGSVRVTAASGASRTIDIAAGHTVQTYVTDTVKSGTGPWSFVVTSTGSGPVYAVRELLLHGAHGALMTSEPLTPLPLPLPLPAVRADPRLALR